MQTYKIDVSEPAEQDLREIVRYISDELLEPETAHNMLNSIHETITKLEYMPKRHPLVKPKYLAWHGYRMIIVKNYLVFFTVDDNKNEVNVERVIYKSRDWAHLI